MKNIIPAITMLFCGIILINACAVSKNSIVIQKSDNENLNPVPAVCFVQLNDGSTKQYTSLKLITGVLTTPYLLADDKIIINTKDIKAYQDKNGYAVCAKLLISKKNSYVAVETLPGFAVKVLSGKLNVYCRKYYNGANSVQEYFIQNGSDGDIVSFSGDVLKNMVKEDAKALEYFNSKLKVSPKSKKMLATVQIFNNGQFITSN